METTATTRGACAAAGRGCGTATGWRNGGRCRHCRRAHNTDAARYRPGTLTVEDHRALIAALNSGATPEQAAAIVNRPLASILRSAAGSSELRAALDGESLAVQHRARQGDYLVSLIRNRRDTDALGTGTLSVWRLEDPLFRDAEAAVKALLDDQGLKNLRGKVDRDIMEQFVAAVEDGATYKAAADALGIGPGWLRYRIRIAAPDLNRRLEAVPKSKGRQRKQVDLDLLRELWSVPNTPTMEIAHRLGVAHRTVLAAAADLGLLSCQVPADSRTRRVTMAAQPTPHNDAS